MASGLGQQLIKFNYLPLCPGIFPTIPFPSDTQAKNSTNPQYNMHNAECIYIAVAIISYKPLSGLRIFACCTTNSREVPGTYTLFGTLWGLHTLSSYVHVSLGYSHSKVIIGMALIGMNALRSAKT